MKMKLLLCFFLLHVVTADDSCPALTNIMKSTATGVLASVKLVCTAVSTPGLYAICPDGYTPTTCVCTNGCWSWSVESDKNCKCQCSNVDMTTARCCKVSFQ
ncbi:resistin-like gamma [Aquarana catesbeiana]|uniref:resistin-like gamma n=1 Tax=Aquarana catesbeiana TaxID=8400 RepID=UPI003CC9A998